MRLLSLLVSIIPFAAFAVPSPEGRPSAAPFVSGDGFRAYADYVYDELDSSLQPSSVKPNSTVFVKTDYLGEFFRKIHPDIPCRYILISHNSDDPAPGGLGVYLDDEKIIAWFTQNYDGYPHPKIHPIPIGIANFCWGHGNFYTLRKVQEMHLPKEHLAYMNFTIQTFYSERWPVFRLFAQAPFCHRTMKKVFGGFLQDLAASNFSISPRGFGLDTHRLWESLYLGTVPIVKTSSLDSL